MSTNKVKIQKPAGIVDRQQEWTALETIWHRPRPQLVFVLGRRRIGKSFLLSRFARCVGGVYYQATRRTEGDQLSHLSSILGEHFDDPALRQGVALPSWERLLDYTIERAGNKPLLVVLDELPYLAASAPALPSIIQRTWDHQLAESRIKLVLSGSFVTAMRALEEADQPLYGRRTGRLVLGPFSFADARGFMPGYSPMDQLVGYGAFGNLPGHLALIDPSTPVAQAAAEALLDAGGPLVDDAQHMLDAFLSEGRVHYSVLQAIASGEQTWSGITRRVGQGGGSLLRPLRWLEEMGLVERVVPITDKAPQRSRRALYRLTDPYLALWHRSVAPLISSGSVGLVEPLTLWEQQIVPRLAEHLGSVFEEACRQLARRGTNLPFQPVRVGQWWDAASRHQVDVVAVGSESELLVGECKLGRITAEDLATLRTRASLIASEMGGTRELHLALFSARDEADSTVRAEVEAGRALYFTVEDVAAA